jgi:uncharacterized protein YdeI (YjbR/CyaY-like superfamily)
VIETVRPTPPKKDLPVKSFASPRLWSKWLATHHAKSEGIWLRMFKKDSGVTSITYAEALDEALCYGWIDGQLKKFDDGSWVQRFTPRRQRSLWSRKNVANAKRLTNAGRMMAAGLREIELAKADGRWNAAYDSPSAMTMPDDFLQQLQREPKANAFFKTLNKSNTYAIAWRLQTAKKPETKERRMQAILEMLRKGQKFH